jgi:hypothetical protein
MVTRGPRHNLKKNRWVVDLWRYHRIESTRQNRVKLKMFLFLFIDACTFNFNPHTSWYIQHGNVVHYLSDFYGTLLSTVYSLPYFSILQLFKDFFCWYKLFKDLFIVTLIKLITIFFKKNLISTCVHL